MKSNSINRVWKVIAVSAMLAVFITTGWAQSRPNDIDASRAQSKATKTSRHEKQPELPPTQLRTTPQDPATAGNSAPPSRSILGYTQDHHSRGPICGQDWLWHSQHCRNCPWFKRQFIVTRDVSRPSQSARVQQGCTACEEFWEPIRRWLAQNPGGCAYPDWKELERRHLMQGLAYPH